MIRRLTIAWALLFGTVLPQRVRAQDGGGSIGGLVYLGVSAGAIFRLLESDVTLRIGDPVRVTRWSGPDVYGSLAGVSPAAVTLRTGDSSVAVGRAEIRRVYRNDGVERKWAQGWGWGFAIGSSSLAFVGYASGDDPPGDLSLTRREKTVLGAVVGGFSGSIIGSLIGAFIRDDHWHSTRPLPASLAVVPGSGTTRVSVGFRF